MPTDVPMRAHAWEHAGMCLYCGWYCPNCNDCKCGGNEKSLCPNVDTRAGRDRPPKSDGFQVADKTCAVAGCGAFYRNHAWGRIHAHQAGWFMQKDETSWCPDHVPEWVAGWRERQAKK